MSSRKETVTDDFHPNKKGVLISNGFGREMPMSLVDTL